VHNNSLPKSGKFASLKFDRLNPENEVCSIPVPKVDSFWAEMLPLGQIHREFFNSIAQRRTLETYDSKCYKITDHRWNLSL